MNHFPKGSGQRVSYHKSIRLTQQQLAEAEEIRIKNEKRLEEELRKKRIGEKRNKRNFILHCLSNDDRRRKVQLTQLHAEK